MKAAKLFIFFLTCMFQSVNAEGVNAMEIFALGNKNVLITGAAGGLGREFALTLAEAGANLVLLDKRKEQLEQVAEEARKFGTKVFTIVVDLNNPKAIQKAVDTAYQESKKIDVLINNAGIGGATSLATTSFSQALEHIEQHYTIHLRATWLLTHEVVQKMIAQKIEGSIINIASICADRFPGGNNATYSAVKAGMVQMTRSMALELASKKIRVNAVLPGLIYTDMTSEMINAKDFTFLDTIPLGTVGQPQDLRATILLLASNKASRYITGSLITIDGGLSAGAL